MCQVFIDDDNVMPEHRSDDLLVVVLTYVWATLVRSGPFLLTVMIVSGTTCICPRRPRAREGELAMGENPKQISLL